jgi:hypothetical protein
MNGPKGVVHSCALSLMPEVTQTQEPRACTQSLDASYQRLAFAVSLHNFNASIATSFGFGKLSAWVVDELYGFLQNGKLR